MAKDNAKTNVQNPKVESIAKALPKSHRMLTPQSIQTHHRNIDKTCSALEHRQNMLA
jgi:hypothetical protein